MPALMRQKPGGVGFYFDPSGIREVHSSKCNHCQRLTEFDSLKRMMDHVEICRGCMKLICLKCAGKPCVPFEKRAEIMEREARLRAAMERATWGCY